VAEDMDLINRIGECGLRVAEEIGLEVIGLESVDLVWLTREAFK
jgi:hypothetical protein